MNDTVMVLVQANGGEIPLGGAGDADPGAVEAVGNRGRVLWETHA